MPTPDLAGLLRRAPNAPIPEAKPGPAIALVPLRLERSKPAAAPTQLVGALAETPPDEHRYLRSITVYLPRSVHQRVRAEAVARDTTATALMLGAINATHDRIGPAFAETQAAKGAASSLFDIPQDREAREPSVQTTIRVTDGQHQALVDLAATHAINRSRLITAALSLHLD